jgi:hypothetical protein
MEKREREELDDDIVGAGNMAIGMGAAVTAVALALVDSGLIAPQRLREVIAAIRENAEFERRGAIGEAADLRLGLDLLMDALDHDWQPGRVAEDVRLNLAVRKALERVDKAGKKPRP